MLEQHVATQGVTHRVQGRQRSLGAQVRNGRREVFAGAGVVAARQQVRLAGAAPPVQRDAGPALTGEDFLQARETG